MGLLETYLQKDFEATPGQRDDRRQWLNNEVANGGIFLQVHKKNVKPVSHQHFLPAAIFVPPPLILARLLLVLRLLGKGAENIEFGLRTKVDEGLVFRFKSVDSQLPRSPSSTALLISDGIMNGYNS